jgi:hypothetical protein
MDVQCSLGEVLDVAPRGLKVRCRPGRLVRVGQSLSMTLATPIGLLSVTAVVVWARRVSFRHTEVGLALEVNDDVRRGLASIALGCGPSSPHDDTRRAS